MTTPEHMFPKIGTDEPVKDEKKEVDPAIKALEDKIAVYDKEREDWNKREERMQNMLEQFMVGKEQTAVAPVAPMEEELPDPVTKPDEFKKAVADRAVREAQSEVAAIREGQTRNEKLSALWSKFEAKYEDLAPHTRLVKGAVSEVLARVSDKGLAADKYMFGNSDRFMEEVAEVVRQDLGAVRKGFVPKGEQAEEEKDRTAGIPGATGDPAPSPKSVPEGSLVADLREAQKSGGFF